MTAETGYLTAHDDVQLRTRTWETEAPRYDILLVHGLGEHSGRWDAPAQFFNARGADVFSYDLRGHGESGGERVHLDSFEDLYQDISDIAKATAASTGRPWVLYGHSLGGLQCGGYLINGWEPHPNVAVLSAPAMIATRGIDSVLKAVAGLAGSILPTVSIPSSITGEQLSRDESVGEAYFADPLVQTTATTKFGKVVYGEQDQLASRHGEIKIPTYVFHGADDELVEPKSSAGLASSDPVVRKVYPGIRHESHNEPEATDILGDVADWIDSKLF